MFSKIARVVGVFAVVCFLFGCPRSDFILILPIKKPMSSTQSPGAARAYIPTHLVQVLGGRVNAIVWFGSTIQLWLPLVSGGDGCVDCRSLSAGRTADHLRLAWILVNDCRHLDGRRVRVGDGSRRWRRRQWGGYRVDGLRRYRDGSLICDHSQSGFGNIDASRQLVEEVGNVIRTGLNVKIGYEICFVINMFRTFARAHLP